MPVNLIRNEKIINIAHRGNSKFYPENTMISMESAYKIGVDVLETDLRLTKDNQLVLFHDNSVERTTDGVGLVKDFTLDEIQELDAGAKFSPDNKIFPYREQGVIIPTAREFFSEFNNIIFNIDIKDPYRIAVDKFLELVDEFELENRIMVGSFHDHQINQVRQRKPQISTGSTYSETRKFVFFNKLRLQWALKKIPPFHAIQVPIQHGRINIVNHRFLEILHERGKALHVWTINDEKVMRDLILMQIDGIFTDDPALLNKVSNESISIINH